MLDKNTHSLDNFSNLFKINISEYEFRDKLEGLINTERYRTQTENFFEFLKKNGINEDNRINMLKLFKLINKNYISLSDTKLVILGDFQKNWLNKLNLIQNSDASSAYCR